MRQPISDTLELDCKDHLISKTVVGQSRCAADRIELKT